jgi:hypothetical protein
MNVTQEQAYKMRLAMRESVNRKGKPGSVVITLTMAEGGINLIDHLLELIQMGKLVECPATPAPSYAQPGLLADEDGGPLFSMA